MNILKTKGDLAVIGGAVAGLIPFHIIFAGKISLMRPSGYGL